MARRVFALILAAACSAVALVSADPVAVAPSGDAEGELVAVSADGRASCTASECASASVLGGADGTLGASVAGDADGHRGQPGATVSVLGTSGTDDSALVAVSGADDAGAPEGAAPWVAVAGGDARGDVSVSALGDASTARPCLLGTTCTTGIAVAPVGHADAGGPCPPFEPERHSCAGAVAVSGTGDAAACDAAATCVAVSGTGRAQGATAVSGGALLADLGG